MSRNFTILPSSSFAISRINFVDLRLLVPARVAARENGEQQNLAVRQPGAYSNHHRLHAGDGFGNGVSRSFLVALLAGVVRGNHQHHHLGLDAVELTVVHAPEDVLGAVAADAKIGGMARRVILVPRVEPRLRQKSVMESPMNKMSMPPCFLRHKTLVAHGSSGPQRHGIGGRVLDNGICRGDGRGVLREHVHGAEKRYEKKYWASDGFHVLSMPGSIFPGEQNFRAGEVPDRSRAGRCRDAGAGCKNQGWCQWMCPGRCRRPRPQR